MRQLLNATEWLEQVYRAGGDGADFAREILDTWLPLDQIEDGPEVLEARKAADEAEAELAAIEAAINDSPLAQEFVTTGHKDTDTELRKFLDAVQDMDDALQDVREVLERGGVLNPVDAESNLAALLVMFVPPVESRT